MTITSVTITKAYTVIISIRQSASEVFLRYDNQLGLQI